MISEATATEYGSCVQINDMDMFGLTSIVGCGEWIHFTNIQPPANVSSFLPSIFCLSLIGGLDAHFLWYTEFFRYALIGLDQLRSFNGIRQQITCNSDLLPD